MDHVRQFDWCSTGPDTEFLTENDFKSSSILKILSGKFYDPLLSSDDDSSEEENINWAEILQKKSQTNNNSRHLYIPGFHCTPHLKLSALTKTQHYQGIKVLSPKYPAVLPQEFMRKPTNCDQKVFEQFQEVYAKEQEEFREWARSLWSSTHCLRALKPKAPVEMVYDAEFQLRAKRMDSWPKYFELAAHLPLFAEEACDMVAVEDLIMVNMKDVPKITLPELSRRCCIMNSSSLPVPCNMHPCRFVLPTEREVTTLPLTEVHVELARYAGNNNASYIISEGALRCLLSERQYMLPISVVAVTTHAGKSVNVTVVDSEFSLLRDNSLVRTQRAFRHLIREALIASEERIKLMKGWETRKDYNNKGDLINLEDIVPENGTTDEYCQQMLDMTVSDEEDDDNLVIDMDDSPSSPKPKPEDDDDDDKPNDVPMTPAMPEESIPEPTTNSSEAGPSSSASSHDVSKTIPDDTFACTCKGSWFERPPPRSYRKWRVSSKGKNDSFDIIVHCSHKARVGSEEAILEPTPEYQIELGASQLAPDRVSGAQLSTMLRRDAVAFNIRIEGQSGDVVTCSPLPRACPAPSPRLHATFAALRGLLPGRYLLRHDADHGSNAILYVARDSHIVCEESISLNFDMSRLAEPDEARCLRTPPELTDELLPVHKSKKLLPLSFTPCPQFVARETNRKPPARTKMPPQAIKWPKKNKNKKKR